MLSESENLKKQLRKLADVIANEALRNPTFSNEIRAALGSHGKRIGNTKKALRDERSLPDPFDVLQSKGSDEFKVWLNELNLSQLRSIVRQHRFDTSRLSDKWKNRERFVELISDRVEARSKHGEVFRRYGQKDLTTNHDEEEPMSDQRT